MLSPKGVNSPDDTQKVLDATPPLHPSSGSQELPTTPVVTQHAPVPAKKPFPLLAFLSLLIGLGACGYASFLQTRLTTLTNNLTKTKMVATQLTAQLKEVSTKTAKDNKDLFEKVEGLDARLSNRFHIVEDVQRETGGQVAKLVNLEGQVVSTGKSLQEATNSINKAILNNQTNLDGSNERINLIIRVIKNQDSVLRQILPKSSAKSITN